MTVVPGFTIVHTSPQDAVASLLQQERALTNHLIGVMGVVRPKTHPQLASWVRGLYTLNSTMVARLERATTAVKANPEEFKEVVNQFLVDVGGDALVLYDKISHDDLPQVAPVVAHLSNYVQFITTAYRICRNPFVADRLADLKQKCQAILHQHQRQQMVRKMNAIRFDSIQSFGTLERNHVSSYFRIDDIVHRSGHASVMMVEDSGADVPVELLLLNLNANSSSTTPDDVTKSDVAYNALAIVRVDGAYRQLAFPPFRVNEVSVAHCDGLTLTAVNYSGSDDANSSSARAQVRLTSDRDDLLATWYAKLVRIFPESNCPIVADAVATTTPHQEMSGLGIGFVSAPEAAASASAPTPPPTPPSHPEPTPEFYQLYDTPSPLRPTLDDLSPNVSLDSLALPVPPAPRKVQKPSTPSSSVYTAPSPCDAPAARLAAGQQRRPAPVRGVAPSAPSAAEFAYTPESSAPSSDLDEIDLKPVGGSVMKSSIYKLPGGSEVDIANFGAGHVPDFSAAASTSQAPVAPSPAPRRRKSFFNLFRNTSKLSVNDDVNGSSLSLGTSSSNKTITSTTPKAPATNNTKAKTTATTQPPARAAPPPPAPAAALAPPLPAPPLPPKVPSEAKESTNIVVFTTLKYSLTLKQLKGDWSKLFHGDATLKFVVNNSVNKGWLFVNGDHEVIELTTASTVRLANPREVHVHARVIGSTEPSLISITTCKATALHAKLSDWLCEADLAKDYSQMSLSNSSLSSSASDNHSAPASKSSTLTSISTYGSSTTNAGVGSGFVKKTKLPAVAETRPLSAHEAAEILRDPLNDRLLVLSNMKIRMSVQTKGYAAIQDPQSWTITGMYSLTLYTVSEARTSSDYLQFALKGLEHGDEVSWMIANSDKKYTLEPIGRAGLLVKCSANEIYMLECKGRKEFSKLYSLL